MVYVAVPGMDEKPITTSILEQFAERRCTEHKEPWTILLNTDGHVFCWICVSKEVRKHFENDACPMCVGFLNDWLDLPLRPSDVFYGIQRTKSFRRITPSFAHGLVQWCNRVHHLDEMVMTYRIHEVIKVLKETVHQTLSHEELMWATATLTVCRDSPFAEELHHWIDVCTDRNVLEEIADIPIFVACWFWRAWNVIPVLHAEHMGWTPPSYAGPAIGMTPNIPNGSNNIAPSPPLISPVRQLQESWIPFPLEEEHSDSKRIV